MRAGVTIREDSPGGGRPYRCPAAGRRRAPDGRRAGGREAGDAVRRAADRAALAFSAFCALYEKPYLAYARLRLGNDNLAYTVVVSALDDLAAVWPTALRSPRAEAVGWRQLESRIRNAAGPAGPAACRGSAVVLLHVHMDLSLRETAQIMGVAVPDVATRLLTLRRATA
jgi:hypothetical protein